MLNVGDVAPDFVLSTDSNKSWRLTDHRGGVTVLLFYPQNETLVCTKQLCAVRDNWESYLATKATIVGISPATADEQREFSNRRGFPMALLADPGRRVTSIYGKHWLYPISFTRAVIVIDANGFIRNRDVMLRAFRPKDDQLITDIYATRGDQFSEKYSRLKQRVAESGYYETRSKREAKR